MKTVEHLPNVRMVIDANHHPPFAAPHKISHALVVFKREVNSVASGLPVRRVHVVEGVGTVVAFGAFEPGEVFDVGTGQTLPGGREVFLDSQQINGRACGGGTECLPGDLAGERMVLQVEESGSALDVTGAAADRP